MRGTRFRTAVVVPYYQRKSGLLLQAVQSVFAQGVEDTLVIVVDDGSPAPARSELGILASNDPRIMLVEQENAGPGAARNRGLAAVPLDVPYIAFLDSDDRWLPGHLARGLHALEHGADFYFADANHQGRGLAASHFAYCGFAPSTKSVIDGRGDVYFYEGDLFDTILRMWPAGTSTVMYRRAVATNVLFPATVRRGEDTYFWLEIARRARRAAFSNCCDVAYGRGVNISLSSPWGTPGALRSILDATLVNGMIATHMPLTEEQYEWRIHELGQRNRHEFAGTLVHLLHHRGKIDWRAVGAYTMRDPRLIGATLEIAIGKLLHRASVPGRGSLPSAGCTEVPVLWPLAQNYSKRRRSPSSSKACPPSGGR